MPGFSPCTTKLRRRPPGGLSERISVLTTHEQFATLLAEGPAQAGGAARTEAALDLKQAMFGTRAA